MEKEEKKNEVEVFSSSNEYEVNQVCSILSDNDIPFIRNDYGSGSYMNLYMGQSFQDKKVFVSEECCDRALELISTIFSNTEYEEDIEELEEVEEIDDSYKKYKWIKYVMGFLVVGFPCMLIALLIIFSIIF